MKEMNVLIIQGVARGTIPPRCGIRLKLIYGSSQLKIYTRITQIVSLHINEDTGCNEYVIQTFFRRKSNKNDATYLSRTRSTLKFEARRDS